MVNAIAPTLESSYVSNALSPSLLNQIVTRVCSRIPPLWDLSNFVAVNPFLGFTHQRMSEAAREIADGTDARVYPPVAYFKRRWDENAFNSRDLERASARHGTDPAHLEKILKGRESVGVRSPGSILTFAQQLDQRQNTHWSQTASRYVARWCSSYEATIHFRSGIGLYQAWLESALVDRSLEIAGLVGWRSWVRMLPATPEAAMLQSLTRFNEPADVEPYLYRLLGGMYGWASWFRRESWASGDQAPGRLGEFLAVLACVDAGIATLAPAGPASSIWGTRPVVEDESVGAVLQDAIEDRFVSGVLKDIKINDIGSNSSEVDSSGGTAPLVHAVFCIDVRSEPFRRNLERESDRIRTTGFAGFFGVSLGWQTESGSSARCPVLLKPAVHLKSRDANAPSALKLKEFQAAPSLAFSFVELGGLFYGLAMLKDVLGFSKIPSDPEHTARIHLDPGSHGSGIAPDVRLTLARGILKNMGLRAPFARLVLLCGHQSHSANNSHAAGLECGACGGHGGAMNARVAASILNDPLVREGLWSHGIDLPETTHFIAGVHDTTLDQVTLMDLHAVPSTHAGDVDQLRRWLSNAGEKNRAERAQSLGLQPSSAWSLQSSIRRRATDGSEVFPEWGLARNALFIAAPRARTRGVNLQGRSFLHDYDAQNDPDHSILTLILSAPMVVASWINLQYFASTVDNHVFGAGTKTLHNRIDQIGVVLGNGGDLRTGLPLQSVHSPDGTWFHEPLRLQVLVEAPTWKIDAVLEAQAAVRQLVENGWVRLFAVEASGVRLRKAGGEWEVFEA